MTLDRCSSVNQTTTLSIAVPGLQRLTVLRCSESSEHDVMLNVNAPCLECLKLEDYWRNVSISDDKKMEKLVEADVSVVFIDNEKLLRALKSAKRLSLCLLTSKVMMIILLKLRFRNFLILDSRFGVNLCRLRGLFSSSINLFVWRYVHVNENGGRFLSQSCSIHLNYVFSSFIRIIYVGL